MTKDDEKTDKTSPPIMAIGIDPFDFDAAELAVPTYPVGLGSVRVHVLVPGPADSPDGREFCVELFKTLEGVVDDQRLGQLADTAGEPGYRSAVFGSNDPVRLLAAIAPILRRVGSFDGSFAEAIVGGRPVKKVGF